MKPSVTIKRKIRMETAQRVNVCWGSLGRKPPKSNEPCQITSVAEMISSTSAEPYKIRFFMPRRPAFDYSGRLAKNAFQTKMGSPKAPKGGRGTECDR